MKTKLKGFSLLEILIAMIVIMALSAIALNNYSIVVEKAKAKEGDQILYTVLANFKRAYVEGTTTASAVLCSDNLRPSANFGQPSSGIGVNLATGKGTFYVTIDRNSSYQLALASPLNGGDQPAVTCSGGPDGLCGKLGYDAPYTDIHAALGPCTDPCVCTIPGVYGICDPVVPPD